MKGKMDAEKHETLCSKVFQNSLVLTGTFTFQEDNHLDEKYLTGFWESLEAIQPEPGLGL